MGGRTLDVEIVAQPDDRSCGATCLDAIYRYFGDELSLDSLIAEIPQLPEGGTLGVHLANHALARGYGAEIYTYNLHLFDPTWFGPGVDLASKLAEQIKREVNLRHAGAAEAYLEFIELGGKVLFEELSVALLRRHLANEVPILTGLSATYLYNSMREVPETDEPDDIAGRPVGHFVIVCGMDDHESFVHVADPYLKNPFAGEHRYSVSIERLLGAILLGIVTYDANICILTPPAFGA